jgi:genome maintenance exonuclease 1
VIYLPNKYPYKEMKRESINGSRKYLTPDGQAVPSVTTILDATKPEEKKKALLEWRKRVGETKAKEITAEAAGRGTRMHKFLENHVKTGIIGDPGKNPYSIQSHTMAQTIISKGLTKCQEFWGTEVGLYFPEVYAGTTDLVGVHDGADAIMDHKQTNKPKKREWIDDYFLQLAAYATAHNEVYNTKIRKGVIFMCSADNQYQEFIVEGVEFDKYTDLWFRRVEEYYKQFI